MKRNAGLRRQMRKISDLLTFEIVIIGENIVLIEKEELNRPKHPLTLQYVFISP
jgi:hypothetical protein